MKQLGTQAGFALLITLVVISIVLAVGLSLMQITLKQLQLTITARDSEVAFYAANAGIECAQAVRNTIDPQDTIPDRLNFNCFNNSESGTYSNSGNTHRYQHESSWDTGIQDICSEVSIFLLDARGGSYTYTFTNLGLESKTCPDGAICTVMFATGYNKACEDIGGLQTVQRELTIE